MDAQTRARAMRFLLNGMRHSQSAPARELITRFTSLLGSEEAAQEAIEEAERIGLLVRDDLISNPTPLEREWRLSKTFDSRQFEVPA